MVVAWPGNTLASRSGKPHPAIHRDVALGGPRSGTTDPTDRRQRQVIDRARRAYTRQGPYLLKKVAIENLAPVSFLLFRASYRYDHRQYVVRIESGVYRLQ